LVDDLKMDILISEEIDAPAITRLAEKYGVVRNGVLWKDADKLSAAVRDARAIIIRNQTQVTAGLLEAAPQLIGIGRCGVGLDNIDAAAASNLGVVIIAPLGANATSVAELTFGLMLSLARKIPVADRSTKSGGWDRKTCTGVELEGRTLAICGFGRIGRKVAERARAFGMRIVVFDPFVKEGAPELREADATLCARLEDALKVADFVTTHMPLTPETKQMFNARAFAAMKPGAFFINTSRGGVVDEAALLNVLRVRALAGAALDVRATEPPAGRGELETMDNVILTPHLGAFTTQAQTRTFEAVAADIDRLLRGEPAVNFVNFPKPKR
jgi:D-3-phosphoglycerate dehydrogenase / 2-oxoglutarate reductase